MQQNARRKAQSEITKTRIDLETKVSLERHGKLMGNVLKDLTKASLDMIEKYVTPTVVAPMVVAAEGEAVPEPAP